MATSYRRKLVTAGIGKAAYRGGAPTSPPKKQYAVSNDNVGAILLEQNDEWAVQRGRCMTLEAIAPLGDCPAVSFSAIAS